LVDDLDDLLGRAEALGQVGADALLADARHHALDDLEVDVGLEQGQADLAQDLVDLGLAQAATAAQAPEDAIEAIGQGLEHEEVRLVVANDASRVAAVRHAKSASTNSSGSNATRSSIASPSPTSFTGIPSSFWMAS